LDSFACGPVLPCKCSRFFSRYFSFLLLYSYIFYLFLRNCFTYHCKPSVFSCDRWFTSQTYVLWADTAAAFPRTALVFVNVYLNEYVRLAAPLILIGSYSFASLSFICLSYHLKKFQCRPTQYM